MKTEDLIGQMVQETISNLNREGTSVLLLSDKDCFKLEAVYDEKRMCFVLSHGDKSIEIPKNWGPFKNRITKQFVLSEFDDGELFIPIIAAFYQEKINSIKISIINDTSVDWRKAA